MQRPSDIATANFGIALKPLLGREKKLKISTTPAIEVAGLEVTAVNALTATASNAGVAALAARPSEVLIKLEEELKAGAAVTIGVAGLDQDDNYLSGVARFAPPSYAQESDYVFPAGTAREVQITSGRKFKSISTYAPTADTLAVGAKFSVFGMPPLTDYVLVGCRVQLDYTPEVREPVSIACGGDDNAFTKPGQKPRRDVSITAKLPSLSDGLARYNGLSDLVLLAVSEKQDKITTDHEFLIGAIVTGGHRNPEASEPSMIEARGLYEDYAHIPAGPLVGA